MRSQTSISFVICTAMVAVASLVTSQKVLAAPATPAAAQGSPRLVEPAPIRPTASQPGSGDGTLRIGPAPASSQPVGRPAASQPGSGDGTLGRTIAVPSSTPSQSSK